MRLEMVKLRKESRKPGMRDEHTRNRFMMENHEFSLSY